MVSYSHSFKWVASAALGLSLFAAAGCSNSSDKETESAVASPAAASVDLSKVNEYLVGKATALQSNVADLKKLSDQYYDLASKMSFDYAALWSQKQSEVSKLLLDAKKLFLDANTSYESMEGIVAGVGELSHYDIDIDAGNPVGDGAEDVVSFDVNMPDGTKMEKPGNFFYLEELMLWGTNPEWDVENVKPDLDGNGAVEFGETLPDANIFKGVTDGFDAMASSLLKDAQAWKATPEDSLTALVVMIPTMEEYFQAWKETRFVSGDQATSRQFVAVSRLQDISDILSGLQVVYQAMLPSISDADEAQATQTGNELNDLYTFVADLYAKEQAGTKFTSEQADAYGADAQNRATAIAGQITQVAAKMGITIDA